MSHSFAHPHHLTFNEFDRRVQDVKWSNEEQYCLFQGSGDAPDDISHAVNRSHQIRFWSRQFRVKSFDKRDGKLAEFFEEGVSVFDQIEAKNDRDQNCSNWEEDW